MNRSSSTNANERVVVKPIQEASRSLPNPFADFPYSCVESYFLTFNAGDFGATAALFAEDGVLFPPFEDGILGQEAIASYLQAEASGMTLNPRSAMLVPPEDEPTQPGQKVEVKGTVKTPLFGVPVRWIFRVNAGDRICSVGIQLQASLEELLHFKQAAPQQPAESEAEAE